MRHMFALMKMLSHLTVTSLQVTTRVIVMTLSECNIIVQIMHLSKYCPTYLPTVKRWGFDLILTPKHVPDQDDLINIFK